MLYSRVGSTDKEKLKIKIITGRLIFVSENGCKKQKSVLKNVLGCLPCAVFPQRGKLQNIFFLGFVKKLKI